MSMKVWAIAGLTAAVMVLAGCGQKKAEPVVEEGCGTCLGGSCKIPAEVAQNTGAGKSALRRIPLIGGKVKSSAVQAPAQTEVAERDMTSAASSASVKPAALNKSQVKSEQTAKIPDSYRTLSGDEGHYNDVKLSGIAHEQPEEQVFLVRKFNRNIWPGGIPLEAEIDPSVMNF